MGEQNYTIATTEELERLYTDAPYGPAVFKETDYVTPEYRKLIEAAPFCVLATCGRDARVALLFLIPGVGETMRINGRARISTDPNLTESFAMNGKVPKCVLVVTVEKAYFQCTKAIIRSKLWDPASKVDRKTLPTPGSILAELTGGKMGGPEHDRLAPERIKQTIY
jgi:predicted pyridoxine 5'-phosphate oxidase superfamily flavin-nucleotide-binding protein